MPPTIVVDSVAFCRALADDTRQEILRVLLQGEKCVSDLAESFCMSQPTISHHLNILKGLGLVTSRKAGKHVFYDINRENVTECCGSLFSKFCCEDGETAQVTTE